MKQAYLYIKLKLCLNISMRVKISLGFPYRDIITFVNRKRQIGHDQMVESAVYFSTEMISSIN